MSLGRMMLAAGGLLVLIGLIVMLGERFRLPFGSLPGDIRYQGKNTSFYFPVVTCVLLSVIISAVMWLLGRR